MANPFDTVKSAMGPAAGKMPARQAGVQTRGQAAVNKPSPVMARMMESGFAAGKQRAVSQPNTQVNVTPGTMAAVQAQGTGALNKMSTTTNGKRTRKPGGFNSFMNTFMNS